jgi:hypothetical protein
VTRGRYRCLNGMTPLLSNPLLRTQSDARLTALAAAGHDHAFEAIVERYRKPLSRYLRRLLSEPLPRTCCRRASCAPGRR